jgi:hypothetical protein
MINNIPEMKKGQGVIEFALILPVLILMITILFDLGRAVLAYSVLNNAVREGTRFAVVLPELCVVNDNSYSTDKLDAIEAHIQDSIYGIQDINNNLNFEFPLDSVENIAPVCLQTDPYIQIILTYKFNPITPGLKYLLGFGNTPTLTVQSKNFLTPYAYPPTPTPTP